MFHWLRNVVGLSGKLDDLRGLIDVLGKTFDAPSAVLRKNDFCMCFNCGGIFQAAHAGTSQVRFLDKAGNVTTTKTLCRSCKPLVEARHGKFKQVKEQSDAGKK